MNIKHIVGLVMLIVPSVAGLIYLGIFGSWWGVLSIIILIGWFFVSMWLLLSK